MERILTFFFFLEQIRVVIFRLDVRSRCTHVIQVQAFWIFSILFETRDLYFGSWNFSIVKFRISTIEDVVYIWMYIYGRVWICWIFFLFFSFPIRRKVCVLFSRSLCKCSCKSFFSGNKRRGKGWILYLNVRVRFGDESLMIPKSVFYLSIYFFL